MKFTLSVIALYVVASMVPRTMPYQMSLEDTQKFLLSVTKNDLIWAEHLNVGIKIDSKKLTYSTRKMLVNLKHALSKITVEPGAEQKPDQEKIAEEKAPEQKEGVWVVQALHIVVEVVSNYDNYGMSLDFAVKSIATAIKCKTLMYIFVQLNAIKQAHEQDNDVITSQSSEILDSLIHVLVNVFAFNNSIDKELELYEQWKAIVPQVNSKNRPSDIEVFQTLVQKSLDNQCELNTLESIKKYIQLDDTDTSKSADNTTNIFKYCQDKLKNMFNRIKINSMSMKNWKLFFNKLTFIKPKKPDGTTEYLRSIENILL